MEYVAFKRFVEDGVKDFGRKKMWKDSPACFEKGKALGVLYPRIAGVG